MPRLALVVACLAALALLAAASVADAAHPPARHHPRAPAAVRQVEAQLQRAQVAATAGDVRAAQAAVATADHQLRRITATSTAAALKVVLDAVTRVVVRLEDMGNGRVPANAQGGILGPLGGVVPLLQQTLAALTHG